MEYENDGNTITHSSWKPRIEEKESELKMRRQPNDDSIWCLNFLFLVVNSFFSSLSIDLIFIIIYFIKFYWYFSNVMANLKRIAKDRTRFTIHLFNHSTWAIGMEFNKWNWWFVNIWSYSNMKTTYAHTVQDQRATTHRRCYLL